MKMKKLKNVWLFLSFILMVAGMASCSTDDDPTGVEVSKEDIIGNWQGRRTAGVIQKKILARMTMWERHCLCRVMVLPFLWEDNITGH